LKSLLKNHQKTQEKTHVFIQKYTAI